ncbi:hypothetical protein [Streptomyces sp. R44]|uniref:PH domain-containing protein n=1 Tax=Streptomyces sp. R44 TaxID=3238633 RepID=A0AB39T3S2_9ACTN
MIYKMLDGTRVRATLVADVVRFETYSFTPKLDVLSVMYLRGERAEERLSWLRALDAIRFGREYGMRGRQVTL